MQHINQKLPYRYPSSRQTDTHSPVPRSSESGYRSLWPQLVPMHLIAAMTSNRTFSLPSPLIPSCCDSFSFWGFVSVVGQEMHSERLGCYTYSTRMNHSLASFSLSLFVDRQSVV